MVRLTFAVGEEEKLRQAGISFGFKQRRDYLLENCGKDTIRDQSRSLVAITSARPSKCAEAGERLRESSTGIFCPPATLFCRSIDRHNGRTTCPRQRQREMPILSNQPPVTAIGTYQGVPCNEHPTEPSGGGGEPQRPCHLRRSSFRD